MGKKLKHARQLAIAQHKERLKLQQKEQKQQGAPHQKPKQPPQLKHQTQQQQPKPKEGGDKEAPGSAAAKAATAQRSASGQSPQSSSPLSSGQPQGIAVDHSPRPEPAEPRAGQQAEGGGTEAEAAPRRAPTQSLYSVSDVILTIGDGNFSFSAALASLLGNAENITATSLDTEEELNDKYSVDVQQHIETVQDCGGRVIHGVDGTKLQECKALRGQRYHKIVFQFPHVGAGIKDQDTNILTNQRTLASFLVSARQFLTRPNDPPLYTASGPLPSTLGEVHITLKSGLPYDEWQVKDIATANGFRLKECRPFNPDAYPGYEHRRTIGYDKQYAGNVELRDKNPRTWIFVDIQAERAAKAKAKGKQQQHGSKKRKQGDGRGQHGSAGKGGQKGEGKKRRHHGASSSDSD